MKIGNIKCYGVIYKITNTINNKVYIGQTTQGFDRRYRHGIIGTHNEYLKHSIEKYGIENFEVIKIFDVAFSKEELDIKEKIYIERFNATNPNYGYNFKTGGANGVPNEATKRKMSENNKGENNPMYGRIGESSGMYGKCHSKETKEKISEKLKGRESCMKGKHHSENAKMKIAKATKGKNNPNSSLYRVIDLDGNIKEMCGNEIYNHKSKGFLDISENSFKKYIKPYGKIDISLIKESGHTKTMIEKLKPFNGWIVEEII